MRKVMAAALLAATVLAPMAANAQDGDRRGGGQGRDGGGQQQGQPAAQAQPAQPQAQVRPGGAGGGGRYRNGNGQGQRGGTPGQPGQPGQPVQAGQYQGRPGGYGGQPDQFQGQRGGQQFAQPGPQGQPGRQDQRGGGYAVRSGEARQGYPQGGYPQGQYPQGGYRDQAGRGGYAGGGNRGYQGGYGYTADRRDFARDQGRFDNRSAWNRGWRSDGRYNYSGYRQSHYGLFRLPRYEAPYGYGYGYRRFGIGATLSDLFFAQDYWIDDPYEYRLPPAYGPYRWVRYYGDALLVDVETGQVVDSVYGIFG